MKSDLLSIHRLWANLRYSLVEIMTALQSMRYPALCNYFLFFHEYRFIVSLQRGCISIQLVVNFSNRSSFLGPPYEEFLHSELELDINPYLFSGLKPRLRPLTGYSLRW